MTICEALREALKALRTFDRSKDVGYLGFASFQLGIAGSEYKRLEACNVHSIHEASFLRVWRQVKRRFNKVSEDLWILDDLRQ